MPPEIDQAIKMQRVALNDDGSLHFLVKEGFCDESPVIDRPYFMKRVKLNDDGSNHYLLSNQKLGEDGKLIIGKPYFMKRVKENDDGSNHYVVSGKKCTTPGNPTLCGCEHCCELKGAVSVNDGSDGWTEPVEVALTCGEQIQSNGGYCCLNDEVEDDYFCFKVTDTFTGKDTLASPEPYDIGSESGTRSVRSEIWSSGDFEIDGETYRLNVWEIEYHIFRELPTTATTEGCFGGWSLQRQVVNPPPDPYGPYWMTLAGMDFATTLIAYPQGGGWLFDHASDNPYLPDDCPEGFTYNAGDLVPGKGCDAHPHIAFDPYESVVTQGFDSCPTTLSHESWVKLVTDPNDCEHLKPCARVNIVEDCGLQQTCEALNAYVAGASSEVWEWSHGCGSIAPTSGEDSYDAISDDPQEAFGYDLLPPDSWKFAEDDDLLDPGYTAVVNISDTPGCTATLVMGFLCITREDLSTYFAFYATLFVSDDDGLAAYYWKTTDISITPTPTGVELSVEGLTPFATGIPEDFGCECGDPETIELNSKLKITRAACP